MAHANKTYDEARATTYAELMLYIVVHKERQEEKNYDIHRHAWLSHMTTWKEEKNGKIYRVFKSFKDFFTPIYKKQNKKKDEAVTRIEERTRLIEEAMRKVEEAENNKG